MGRGIAAASGRPDVYRGWAIPGATDIAFSYMVARVVFPAIVAARMLNVRRLASA